MTPLIPELAREDVRGVFDGERSRSVKGFRTFRSSRPGYSIAAVTFRSRSQSSTSSRWMVSHRQACRTRSGANCSRLSTSAARSGSCLRFRRVGVVRGGLRAGARGGRGEAARLALPVRRARMGQGQKPFLFPAGMWVLGTGAGRCSARPETRGPSNRWPAARGAPATARPASDLVLGGNATRPAAQLARHHL
jgi:hypothetical protein